MRHIRNHLLANERGAALLQQVMVRRAPRYRVRIVDTLKDEPDHRSRMNVVSVTGGDTGLSKLLAERPFTASAWPHRGRLERIKTLETTRRKKPEPDIDDRMRATQELSVGRRPRWDGPSPWASSGNARTGKDRF
jgi:hypothetical protein